MCTKTDTNRKTHPNSEIIAKSNTEGTESISYKMLTLFVRFMLWDSRKLKKIRKQPYTC